MVSIQCKIKLVHHSRDKETYLAICKSLTDAVARSKAEGLEDKTIIPVKAMIIERV